MTAEIFAIDKGWTVQKGHLGALLVVHPESGCRRNAVDLPDYTSSIDSALTIGAEELAGWSIQMTIGLTDADAFMAQNYVGRVFGAAKTLPIAVCIARLTALAALREVNHV